VFSSPLIIMRSVDLGVVTVIVGTEGHCDVREFADAFLRGVSGPDSGTDSFSSLGTGFRVSSERDEFCACRCCACEWAFAVASSSLAVMGGTTNAADGVLAFRSVAQGLDTCDCELSWLSGTSSLPSESD
jgi:hypothetical protein